VKEFKRSYDQEEVEERDELLLDAEEIRQQYGLTYLTTEQVKSQWEAFSNGMSAGWLIPGKKYVEACFDVVLEERE
jgi:hypothetical protein